MTDKLIMTTADRDYFLKCIKTLCTGSHSDATRTAQTLQDMLQSLPMVDREPVAWRHDHGEENGGFEYYEEASCDKCQPLYTSPQALTPITADDVTEAIRQEFLTKDVLDEAIAAVFNFIVTHRSEAK